MDLANDQYSIKNLLFTKAIPNYVIPVPTTGHKVFACNDCGDKFILQSSYDYHTNRKSVKISYYCRHCNVLKIFYNRCNLLNHIRSHSFKTATINVGDLKLDPLPLNFYNRKILRAARSSAASAVNSPASAPSKVSATPLSYQEEITTSEVNLYQGNGSLCCLECNEEFSKQESTTVENRAKHYMKFTNETYTCPFCLFTVPTTCALSTHLRFHFKIPPYLCPECGGHLSNFLYPFDHKCEGFMMLRATVRVKCPAPNCQPFHPNDFKEHHKLKHLKAVFKCPCCYVACFDEQIMANHLKNHQEQFPLGNGKCVTFYQCDLCPGKLILQTQVETHYKSHSPCNTVYPCWVCGKAFNDMVSLASHHMISHEMNNPIRSCIQKLMDFQNKTPGNRRKVYRVIKRCDQCKRSFSYKCKFEQINKLPNECPYNCTPSSGLEARKNKPLICNMCKHEIPEDWDEIKKHYKEFHPIHRCVDIKVVISKINIDKYLPMKTRTPDKKKNSRRFRKKHAQKQEVGVANEDTSINKNPDTKIPNITGELVCKLCNHECENKDNLEKHLLTHRDPCMAYQCMECGQCFVVKPSFSKHLIIEHNISNIEDYINQKQCYNENALMKYQDNPEINEPLRENQCKICREQFENADDLEKHFRVHGMAFLMKNKTNSP